MNASNARRIKVLVIDDSALIRGLLTEILGQDQDIEVVGAAQDAFVAREKIKQLEPDVLTLDVEMPRMDGLQFLRNLMRLRPMPVVMCSSLTERGADVTLTALELGAVDFVTKPRVDIARAMESYAAEIIGKVRVASRARVRPLGTDGGAAAAGPQPVASLAERAAGGLRYRTTDQIIAIGASTGGTEAIREVLCRMPPDSPGIVVTQHIPKAFSGPFAARMNTCSQLTVQEAGDGQLILPGHCYIAPGDLHLLVERDGARYRCRLSNADPISHHRPSVDVLFQSVAQQVGANAIGAILTGMGADGARGMKAMRAAGAQTIAQDERTSVVWGMPGSAVQAGAVARVLPLQQIAEALLTAAGAKRDKVASQA
ncbi:MAG: chemotaxis response regulator protein-glutamate methylesterase [Steroidobacteraceae bacterium]